VDHAWSRRERIEFEWLHGYTPGPVTLTESFRSVRSKAPSAAASSFFRGYALEVAPGIGSKGGCKETCPDIGVAQR
jgi:hypothetical protein